MAATVERTISPEASNVKPSTLDTMNAIQSSSSAKGFYEALNRAKSRNPFFSDTVPPRLNLWGEVMSQCVNGSWCFISPIRVKTTKGNLVDAEMVALGVGLRMPTRNQRGVMLTSDQYNEMILRMNEIGGVSMLDEMTDLINTDVYKKAEIGGDEGKLDLLRSIVTQRKKIALDEMFADSMTGLQEKKDALDDYFTVQGRRLRQ